MSFFDYGDEWTSIHIHGLYYLIPHVAIPVVIDLANKQNNCLVPRLRFPESEFQKKLVQRRQLDRLLVFNNHLNLQIVHLHHFQKVLVAPDPKENGRWDEFFDAQCLEMHAKHDRHGIVIQSRYHMHRAVENLSHLRLE